jgi:hypothetical protein
MEVQELVYKIDSKPLTLKQAKEALEVYHMIQGNQCIIVQKETDYYIARLSSNHKKKT